MIFKEEIITKELLEEAKPLLYKHWEEIAHYKDIPLDPDFDLYLKMQAMGAIRSYSVRNDEGKLVGYACFFVRHNGHYKQTLYAVQDIVFIDPECRGGGFKFIRWCDEQLRELGVNVVTHHIKAAHNFGPALERMGYTLQDLIYSRRLN